MRPVMALTIPVVAVILTMMSGGAGDAIAAVGDMRRVSVDSAGSEGNNGSGSAVVSANGRFVAFRSTATNLVTGDTNGSSDVFVHDLRTGETTRVSVDSMGSQVAGNGGAGVTISGDGRFVAFDSSSTALVPEDTSSRSDIFVRDRQTGTTTRVSVSTLDAEANSDCVSPSISGDGRFVAFVSAASNLVPGDTNGRNDVFVHDRDTDRNAIFDEPNTGGTVRVSVDSAAGEATGGFSFSLVNALSADGRYVTFSSTATNLVPGDSNGQEDVFVHDRDTDADGLFDEAGAIATLRVSVGPAGVEGDNFSNSGALSPDGRFVAFLSFASNLTPGDTNGFMDVFVRNLRTSTTTRVSVDSAGGEANASSQFAAISGDDRSVVFGSDASNLLPMPDTNGATDVFLHDLVTGATTRISVDAAGNEANGASGLLGVLGQATISSDYGRVVAFTSLASNLVPTDGNSVLDVFVKELALDRDGDGLLDEWETAGYDADGDGVVDVDLPAMGANPLHKDLFLELDTMTGELPTRRDIQRMKEAFAAAPLTAGGSANPDGLAGITVHVDTGSVADPTASEGGTGSCNDGIDNDHDGDTDGADTDCLLGDNLGGGNALSPSSICNLNSAFYAAKATNFDPKRRLIFRYAISARGCGNSGGQGEIGGNDFIEYNHDGGTIMHELGHTLELRHGGFENANCKPDYVSVMNYDNQFNVRQRGGGTILDYAPPRFPGGRGVVPTAALVENALDESTILDAGDGTNMFVFTSANGVKVLNPMNAVVDWNGNMGQDPGVLTAPVNIDTCGNQTVGNPPMTVCLPTLCANSATNSSLKGYDDWSNISLGFARFGDSGDGAVNPVADPEPTLDELLELEQALSTARLDVTRLKIRASRSATRPDGRVSVRGEFILGPGDVVDTAGGVTVDVDGEGLAVRHTWPASECQTLSRSKVKCATADRSSFVRFRPFSQAPALVALDVSVRRLGLLPPFRAPIDVSVTTGVKNRIGTISSCRATNGAGLFCRVP